MHEALALAIALLLLGSPGQPMAWSKPAATAADFIEDQRACRSEAEQAAASIADPLLRGLRFGERMRQCLQTHGWTPHGASR